MEGKKLDQPDSKKHNSIGDLAKCNPTADNLYLIVANKKPTKPPQPPCPYLIAFTERLAEEAKRGTLRGLGGFVEYSDGYVFGLEGSYYKEPESALVPLKRLEKRIIDRIEENEQQEDQEGQ